MTGAWRYTTEACRRVYRWYAHVGPAERAPTPPTDCTAVPGPLPPAPVAWAKPAAAGLLAGGVIAGAVVGGVYAGAWVVSAGSGDRAGTDTSGVVAGLVGYEVAGSAGPYALVVGSAAGASPGAGMTYPSLLADVARDTQVGLIPTPPGGTPGTFATPSDDTRTAIPEPASIAVLLVGALVAVGVRRRAR